MMFAMNTLDGESLTVANAGEYSARVQREAESAEQVLWNQAAGQLLNYARLVFGWCESRRNAPPTG